MILTVVFNDVAQTRFMQTLDVFENFKIVCRIASIETNKRFTIKKFLKSCEGQPYIPVAVFNDKKVYYRDENVKSCSTGTHWFALDDILPEKSSINGS